MKNSNSYVTLLKRASLRDEIERELATRRFREFVRQAWFVVEPAQPFLSNWHIDAICDHLQAVTNREIQYLLINIPPGHAKSLLCAVLWPAWVWGLSTAHISGGPRWRALFTSYSEVLARRDSIRSRNLLDSRWYCDNGFRLLRGGDVLGNEYDGTTPWQLTSDQNVATYYRNTEMGERLALSVGGKGTGFRGHAIVCDDPLNVKDQFSDAARREVNFWWDQVMSSRLNDQAVGSKVIIQQRVHAHDLAGHVLELGGYEHLNLPSEYEPERRSRTFHIPHKPSDGASAEPLQKRLFHEDPRTEFGQLLFPSLFPRKVIDQAKLDLGSQGFAGQHQQRPSAEEGGILKRHWWKFWKPIGSALGPVMVKFPDNQYHAVDAIEIDPKANDVTIQSWDCAFKDVDTADYVVGVVQGRRDGGDRFLLDLTRARMDLPRTIAAVLEMTKRWPHAYRKYVEDKANGPAVVQSLRHQITGLIEVTPEGGKIARAFAVSPEVEAGNWYIPHPQLLPWVQAFLDECADFPNGMHDDQVDAFTQGGIKLSRGNQYGLIEAVRQEQEKAQSMGPADYQRMLIDAQKGFDAELAEQMRSVSALNDVIIAGNANAFDACPKCGSVAVTAIAGHKRCQQCAHEFGFRQVQFVYPSRKGLF